MRSRRNVVVFTLGGTIAMSTKPGRDGGVVPRLSAEQLVAVVPGLSDIDVRLDARSFRQLPGASLGFDDIIDHPVKARVLLHLMIAAGADLDATRAAFARAGGSASS